MQNWECMPCWPGQLALSPADCGCAEMLASGNIFRAVSGPQATSLRPKL